MSTRELMEKVAEVRPDFLQAIEASRGEVQESPFKDEILGSMDGILKTAAFGGALGAFGRGAASVGGAVGAGIAASLAGDLYDALKRGITKTRNYKAMVEANPDLHDRSAKDVQSAFSTLHTFNPDFAADPHVAGSYVRQQLTLAGDSGQVDLHTLTSLVGARKNLADVKKLPSVNLGGHGRGQEAPNPSPREFADLAHSASPPVGRW